MSTGDDLELRMKGYSLVTVNVLYFMPDHRSLVNEFIWQTLDLKPQYPRVEQFLDHWRREIDAIIKEVLISDAGYNLRGPRFTNVSAVFRLH